MSLKLKDVFNLKKNKSNGQFSADIRKKVLKKEGIDIKELLNSKIDICEDID